MPTKERTHEDIRAELADATAEYQKVAQTHPESVWRPLSDKVKSLGAELRDSLSVGASLCVVCGSKAMGLRHAHVKFVDVTADAPKVVQDALQPGQRLWQDVKYDVFEVGCSACSDGRRAQGESPEEAVQNWNKGVFIPRKDR